MSKEKNSPYIVKKIFFDKSGKEIKKNIFLHWVFLKLKILSNFIVSKKMKNILKRS